MNVLIILAHPEPGSFNAHLATAARDTFEKQGNSVRLSDLYAMNFDPVEASHHFSSRRDPDHFDAQTEQRHGFESNTLPQVVQDEIEKIQWAELVVFQFPLWWFGLPAILKGWMDRVFVYGGLYSGQHRHDTGPCRSKRALLSVTTGSSETACSYNGKEGDTQLILWPTLYSLRYVGFEVLQPLITHSVHAGYEAAQVASQARYMERAIQRFLGSIQQLDSLPRVLFNTHDHWNDQGQLKQQSPAHSPFIRQRKKLELG
jgi:NAD(P)H dehydrogenase (quinone)